MEPGRLSSRTVHEGIARADLGSVRSTLSTPPHATPRRRSISQPMASAGSVSHPRRRTKCMPRIVQPRPTHRACSWCASEFAIAHRPGRPRLYCRHSCRQRAYEHRHGFEHQRTVRPLPGQVIGDSWSGSGYERGGSIAPFGRTHALRTSVRPEGCRRDPVRPPGPPDQRPTLHGHAPSGVPYLHDAQ